MEKIHELAFQLHDMLLTSNEYKILKEKEQLMLSDVNCSSLLDSYHKAIEKYNDNKSDSNLKLMHEAKLKLDENLLVKEYKNAYKNYQILVGNITDIVFLDFKKNNLVDKIIRAK